MRGQRNAFDPSQRQNLSVCAATSGKVAKQPKRKRLRLNWRNKLSLLLAEKKIGKIGPKKSLDLMLRLALA
jgi:hypothetical protein